MVVEIQELMEHMLKDCQSKNQFRQCPRCQEAVDINIYQDHVQLMSCIP